MVAGHLYPRCVIYFFSCAGSGNGNTESGFVPASYRLAVMGVIASEMALKNGATGIGVIGPAFIFPVRKAHGGTLDIVADPELARLYGIRRLVFPLSFFTEPCNMLKSLKESFHEHP